MTEVPASSDDVSSSFSHGSSEQAVEVQAFAVKLRCKDRGRNVVRIS